VTNLQFLYAADIIAKCIVVEIKLLGGARPVSMLPPQLARFG
jgi:hypothetical protein